MKFVVQDLHFGDVIEVHVSELLSESEVIMSFQGDLLRVQNQSRLRLEVGQKLSCRVSAVNPLRFEIMQAPPSFKIDRTI